MHTETTLDVQKLGLLLKNIDMDSFVNYLDLPYSKLAEINRKHHVSYTERKQAHLELYVNHHPSPSWKHIARSLYQYNYLSELDVAGHYRANSRGHYE